MTAMEFVRLLVEGGMPPGVVNLVNGAPGPMGQVMLARPDCAKVHFTGSVRVGKLLMDGASKTVTRLSLELGGNAPVLVFPDVDLAQLAAGATAAKFRNGGQVCISPQRFLVARSAVPEFVDRVAESVSALRVGAGLDPDTQVGPLINAQQRDRVEALVGSARTSGAHIQTGGRRPAHLDKGYFYEPTVVADVTPSTPLYHEEIFGPVLPITAFDDIDEAIALANDTRYGLAAYVWTNNLTAALRTAERLQFGMVGVNEWTPQSIEAPFVGWKESGLGREAGRGRPRGVPRDQARRDRGHAVMSEGGAHIERTLGRWDLVLLKVVAIVNINNVPPVAVYGWFSLVLWALAFVCFFIPEAIAVLVLGRRHPGEGGIYLWTRKEFGDAHGFLSGWCYWTNNLFYIPVLLVYMSGIFAFAGGEARAQTLVDQKLFVAAVSFGWLALITVANIRGLAVGKWIQNIGGLGAFLSVGLVLAAAGAAAYSGFGAHAPTLTGVSWEMATSFAVMCNALVGIELASTMGDEIRNPKRDLGPAIAIAGAVSIGSYSARHRRRAPAGAGQSARRDPGHHAGRRRGRECRPHRLAGDSAGDRHGHRHRRRGVRLVCGLVAHSVRCRPDERAPAGARTRASAVAFAARRAHHLRRPLRRLHVLVAPRIERRRGVPGAAQGGGRHSVDSLRLPVPRARQDARRVDGGARCRRGRSSDDGRGAGRGISPDRRCVERVGLRNQARHRGGRSDRARTVSLLARPRLVAGACRTNRVTCARMESS